MQAPRKITRTRSDCHSFFFRRERKESKRGKKKVFFNDAKPFQIELFCACCIIASRPNCFRRIYQQAPADLTLLS